MPKPMPKGSMPLPNPLPDRPLRKAKAKEPRASSRRGPSERRVKLEIPSFEPNEGLAEHVLMPVFIIADNGEWRPVHCESDVLARLPWEEVNLQPMVELDLPEMTASFPEFGHEPDIDFAGVYLLDVLPDALRAGLLAREVFDRLFERLGPQKVADHFLPLLGEMHRYFLQERERLARQVVHELIEAKRMRFLVVADEFASPAEKEPVPVEAPLPEQFEFALFEPTPVVTAAPLERVVVTMPSAQEPLFFWYGARAPHESEAETVFVLEKEAAGADGRLARMKDPRKVFTRCANLAEEQPWSDMAPRMRSRDTRFELLDEAGWNTRLRGLLQKKD